MPNFKADGPDFKRQFEVKRQDFDPVGLMKKLNDLVVKQEEHEDHLSRNGSENSPIRYWSDVKRMLAREGYNPGGAGSGSQGATGPAGQSLAGTVLTRATHNSSNSKKLAYLVID